MCKVCLSKNYNDMVAREEAKKLRKAYRVIPPSYTNTIRQQNNKQNKVSKDKVCNLQFIYIK